MTLANLPRQLLDPTLLKSGIADLRQQRHLIGYLVRANMKKTGADRLIGNLWWLLDPILQMLAYALLVSVIFNRGQPDYPLFIFVAILPWKWLSTSLTQASSSIVARDKLIRQLPFPKLVLPAAATFAGIGYFAFGLLSLLAMMFVFYTDRVSAWMFLLPIVVLVQLAFILALALLVAVLGVYFRDLSNLMRHILRIWFLISPTLYGQAAIESIERQAPWASTLLPLNPMAPILNSYRNLIYGGSAPDWIGLLLCGAASLLLLAVALVVFKRFEPRLVKEL